MPTIATHRHVRQFSCLHVGNNVDVRLLDKFTETGQKQFAIYTYIYIHIDGE